MVIFPLKLKLDTVHFTDEQFYQLCQKNSDLKFERTSTGELIIMPPVGGESGNREADLITDLGIWNRQTGLGYTFILLYLNYQIALTVLQMQLGLKKKVGKH